MGLGIYADGPDGIYAGYQEQLYELRDELAEKDRIIAALRIMAVDGLTIMHDTATPLDAAIAQVDAIIEQARSGK
jgi:hypothetical protein